MIIKSHHNALRLLSKTKGRKFNIMFNNTPNMSKAVKVLCRYILNGTIPIKKKHLDKLKPHRNFIRKIASANESSIKGHIQKGGNILQSILQTVVPLVSMLL